jgi:hypothetical protein
VTIFLGVCAAWSSGFVFAQSALEFDIWMQKIDQRSQSVLRNISVKDVDATVADAQEIRRLYSLMETFYAQKDNANDAVMASYDGKELADSVVKSALQKDFETAFSAALGITKDCRACHVRYKPL